MPCGAWRRVFNDTVYFELHGQIRFASRCVVSFRPFRVQQSTYPRCYNLFEFGLWLKIVAWPCAGVAPGNNLNLNRATMSHHCHVVVLVRGRVERCAAGAERRGPRAPPPESRETRASRAWRQGAALARSQHKSSATEPRRTARSCAPGAVGRPRVGPLGIQIPMLRD